MALVENQALLSPDRLSDPAVGHTDINGEFQGEPGKRLQGTAMRVSVLDFPETIKLESTSLQPQGTALAQALSDDPEIRALEEQLIAARQAKATGAITDAAAARKAELQAEIDAIGTTPYVPVNGGTNA